MARLSFRYIITVLYLLGGGTMFGQTLNNVYPQITNIRAALAFDSSYYYVSGINNLDASRLDYLKIDKSGNVISNLRLQYNDSLFFMINSHNGLLNQRAKLVSVFTNYIPGSIDSAFILINIIDKGDFKLDTSIRFSAQGFKYTEAFSADWSKDSSLLITGAVRTYDIPYKQELLLAKFDNDFNLIWQTTVPGNSSSQPLGPIGGDIVVSKNGAILVTGAPYYHAAKQMTFSARFGPSGGLQYYREYFHPLGSSGMHCVDNGDGTYQYVMNSWTNSSGSHNQLHVGIMDTNGNLMSRDTIGQSNRAQFAVELIKTSDGNYYTSGSSFFGTFYCFGAKFSSIGDSLWYRGYRYQDTFDLHFPESFFETQDSGILHLSTFGDYYNPDSIPTLFTWLYKTDRYGCLIDDCHIGLKEHSSFNWDIYPNPSSGALNISVSSPCTVKIYSSNSQELIKKSFYSAGNYTINLDKSTKGMYNVVCVFQDQIFTKQILIF